MPTLAELEKEHGLAVSLSDLENQAGLPEADTSIAPQAQQEPQQPRQQVFSPGADIYGPGDVWSAPRMPKRQTGPGWKAEIDNALARGGLRSVASGPGTLAALEQAIARSPLTRMIYPRAAQATDLPALDTHAKSLQETAKLIYDEAGMESLKPRKSGTWGYIANTTFETLPMMAAATAAGAATGGAGAFMVGAMTEGESAYQEAIKADADEGTAQTERLIVGAINGVIERMQADEILKVGKGISRASLQAIGQAAKERSLRKLGKEVGKTGLGQIGKAVNEGIEESLQEAVSIGAATMHGDKIDLSQDIHRVGEAAVGGFTAGGLLGLGGSIAQTAVEPDPATETTQEPPPATPQTDMTAPEPATIDQIVSSATADLPIATEAAGQGVPVKPTPTPGAEGGKGPITTEYSETLARLKSEMGDKAYFDDRLDALRNAEPQEVMDKYRTMHPKGPAVLFKAGSNDGALIAPSAREPGKFQKTWFDERGLAGHSTHKTEAAAFGEAFNENYVVPDPLRGVQQMASERFRQGVKENIEIHAKHRQQMKEFSAKAKAEPPIKPTEAELEIGTLATLKDELKRATEYYNALQANLKTAIDRKYPQGEIDQRQKDFKKEAKHIDLLQREIAKIKEAPSEPAIRSHPQYVKATPEPAPSAAIDAQSSAGKTKFDQTLADQAAQGGDPELELLLLKRRMLTDKESPEAIRQALNEELKSQADAYDLDVDTVQYLRATHIEPEGTTGYQASVGAASINWKSRRNAVDKAQKVSAKVGKPMYVVQGSTGKYSVRTKRPPKGNYTLVDMKQSITDQVRFVKQASPTVDEAFDYGEHPKENQKYLSKLQKFKKQLKEKNANLVAIQAEMFDYIRQNVPKAEQHRYLSILQRVNPKARTTTTLKDLAKVITKTEELLQGTDKRVAIAELKKAWKGIQSTYRRGQMKLGKLDKVTRDRITQLMDKIDVTELSAGKRTELENLGRRINALARELGTAMQQVDPATGAMLLEVPEARIVEMARLGRTPIRRMTAEDIQAITDTLKYYIHQFETKQQILRENDTAERSAVLTTMLDEVVPTREARRHAAKDLEGLPLEIKRPARRFLRRILKTESAHLDTLAELMTRPGETETRNLLSDSLNEGWRRRGQVCRDAFTRLRTGLATIGFTYKDLRAITKDTLEIKIGNVKRKLRVDYVMGLYMHMQNSENVQRFLTTEGHVVEGELLPAFDDLAQIMEATDQLTDKQKAFCDLYPKLNNEILAPAINEVALRTEGYELAINPNHWRIHRALPKKVAGRMSDVAIEDTGPFQPRTGGTQRIELKPFTQEVVNNIQTSATYAGLAIPMKNLRSIVNSSEWQNAMKRAGHQDLVGAAITIIRRVQGYRTDQSVAEMAGQVVLSKFARSVLGLRVSAVGNQILSAPVAQSEIPRRYFLKAITKAQVRERVKKMTAGSPLFWERWTGKKISVEVGTLMAQHTLETLIYDKSPILEALMKGLVWGDQVAIAHIHAAAEAETRALHPELEGDALDEAVIRRTEYVTRRTQPMWDMLNRSVLSSSPSLWLRLGLMFRSAREKQWNVLLRANNALIKTVRQDKAKALDAYARATGGVVAANFAIAGWKSALRWGLYTGTVAAFVALGLIDPDDEKPDKKEQLALAARLTEDTAGNVLSLMPGGQHLQSGMKLAARRARGEHVWKAEPYDDPIGQLFSETYGLVFDKAPQIAQEMASGDRFASGPRKGELKWRGHAEDAAADAVIVAAKVAGVPLPGPMQEFYWPVQRALRKHDNPYRQMTPAERLLTLYKSTYAESREAFPADPSKWLAHEGQEDKVAQIKKAVGTPKIDDFRQMQKLRMAERMDARKRSMERQRRVRSSIRDSRDAERR